MTYFYRPVSNPINIAFSKFWSTEVSYTYQNDLFGTSAKMWKTGYPYDARQAEQYCSSTIHASEAEDDKNSGLS